MKVYQKIAQILVSIENCRKNKNVEWQEKWESELLDLFCKCPIELKDARLEKGKLILEIGWYALDNMGGVIGYITPKLTVSPDICWGFEVSIRGWKSFERRNSCYGLVEYLENCVHEFLDSEI